MEQKINKRIKVTTYKNFFEYLLKYSFKVNDNNTKHKYKSPFEVRLYHRSKKIKGFFKNL